MPASHTQDVSDTHSDGVSQKGAGGPPEEGKQQVPAGEASQKTSALGRLSLMSEAVPREPSGLPPHFERFVAKASKADLQPLQELERELAGTSLKDDKAAVLLTRLCLHGTLNA